MRMYGCTGLAPSAYNRVVDEQYGTVFPHASGGSVVASMTNEQLLELTRLTKVIEETADLSDFSDHPLSITFSESLRRAMLPDWEEIPYGQTIH